MGGGVNTLTKYYPSFAADALAGFLRFGAGAALPRTSLLTSSWSCSKNLPDRPYFPWSELSEACCTLLTTRFASYGFLRSGATLATIRASALSFLRFAFRAFFFANL